MPFDINRIAAVYEEEALVFSADAENRRIDLNMDTDATRGIRFPAVFADPQTVLFLSTLPITVPEETRAAAAAYLAYVNCGLLVGGFELDMEDGEVSYKTVGCFEPDSGLSPAVILRLTYAGFSMIDRYLPGLFDVAFGGKQPQQAFAEIEQQV